MPIKCIKYSVKFEIYLIEMKQ